MQNDYVLSKYSGKGQNFFTRADLICRVAEKISSGAESRPKGATKFCPRDITLKRLVFAISPYTPEG